MPELLLEFLSEEIPARMQTGAGADLARLLSDKLEGAGLPDTDVQTHVGPRRLTAVIEDLPSRSPDVREERKGPRVGAPEKALQGFLRGAGLDSLDQAQTRSDKKGDFYIAVLERPGRATPDILMQVIPEIVRGFPWPKSMRWGAGALRWVRPLQSIVCVYDGEPVRFTIDGVPVGDVTRGHRVMGPGPFTVSNFDGYAKTLATDGRVVVDAAERAALIHREATKLCEARGLELVEDQGLLSEVAGLAEWPVPLLGDMDPAFLDLPPEVIQLSMRTHQKYFAVRDAKTGELAPHFIMVANQDAPDGGAAITAGAARVLSARLNDARYFWDNDRRAKLDHRFADLDDIIFHQRLGSMWDKTTRLELLARDLAPAVGADPDLAALAARFCKADLVSEMVYEFPELQGVMGRYYWLIEQGLDPLAAPKKRLSKKEKDIRAVADAIRDHYKPLGPSDEAPTVAVSAAVALADKLDTLIGFWVVEEKPTGSSDPYALRRAALGVVRILLATGARIPLGASEALELAQIPHGVGTGVVTSGALFDHLMREVQDFKGIGGLPLDELSERGPDIIADLHIFCVERLRVYLRDQGKRHDVIDAVFAPRGDRGVEGDIVVLARRVDALGPFLETEDGAELAAGYKRAANILKAEEKKDRQTYEGDVDRALLSDAAETALADALAGADEEMTTALTREDYSEALAALARVRPAVDRFFDDVTVNAEDAAVRRNRLFLLSGLRALTGRIADFSRLEGR